jgi:hypothetical protein
MHTSSFVDEKVSACSAARPVKPNRLLLPALLIGATAAGLGCRDVTLTGADPRVPPPAASVSAVASAPASRNAVKNGVKSGMLDCASLAYDSVTATIDRWGGVLHMGPHALAIPPGALEEPVIITAIAPQDTVDLVRLQPEGLVFAKPVSLTLSYKNCFLDTSKQDVRIAHLSDSLQMIEYVPSTDTRHLKQVTGSLQHFSNYAIAW